MPTQDRTPNPIFASYPDAERLDLVEARWLGDGTSDPLRRRLSAPADRGSVTVPLWRGRRRFFTRRGPDPPCCGRRSTDLPAIPKSSDGCSAQLRT
jgi:hypothetical protein